MLKLLDHKPTPCPLDEPLTDLSFPMSAPLPAQPRHPALFRRLTASVPFLVTVIIHIVFFGIAGAIVVQQAGEEKKRTFEASNQTEAVAVKQVEHRLQVARRGGASGGAQSPVSANRIVSVAAGGLALPEMPDLPSMGAGGFGGFGGMGSGVGLGAGAGMSTSLGSGTGLGGRGFMSLNFLGLSDVRSNKVVFVVDISPSLMDIRKGGFRAFEILRMEISRLVAGLPLSNEFNVVLFDGTQTRLFAETLQPANSANKNAFFAWIAPINASLDNIGARSIPASSPRWSFTRPEAINLDPNYGPASWIQALQAALTLEPDTVFVITGSGAIGQKRLAEDVIARRRAERAKAVEEAAKNTGGIDHAAIAAARSRAVAKLRADFDAINQKLVAQKKPPFVITDIRRVLAADFQAALKKAGFSLKIDGTGWTDKDGNLIWTSPPTDLRVPTTENADASDMLTHISRLQSGLLRQRAALHIFLFTGPDEDSSGSQRNLSTVATRNGGRFSLLTTKRLEELAGQQP